MVVISLWTVRQSLNMQSLGAEATGIDERNGNLIVRLSSGTRDSVFIETKFTVVNNASRTQLGILEVIEVEESSCLCRVFDIANEDFWRQLESRMKSDPSPPAGITFSREVNHGILESIEQILRNWV